MVVAPLLDLGGRLAGDAGAAAEGADGVVANATLDEGEEEAPSSRATDRG